jgi:hypothetical protein
MYKIRRIGIGSAFKMGFALNTIVGLILGFFLLLLPTLLGGMFFLPDYYRYGGNMLGLGGGIIGALISLVVLVLFSGVLGGIGAMIYAFLYNLAAGWMGGVEVEMK